MCYDESSCSDLAGCLALGPREHLALVGGGGKTSLMFALAEELRGRGSRVVIGTTTRIARREAERALALVFAGDNPRWWEDIREGLARAGCVLVAERRLVSGKVRGIHPRRADALCARGGADYLVWEADGAAQRPLKAPAAHEPVIPATVTAVVAVMGLEALGLPLAPETVFRSRTFSEISGLASGEILTPRALTRALHHPRGLFRSLPARVRRLVFLNKVDQARDPESARELARNILQSGALEPVERVIIGSVHQGRYRVMSRSSITGFITAEKAGCAEGR